MIKDRAVMEAHLALLGWVPFSWCKGGAHNPLKNDIVVWVNYDDTIGWSQRAVFPTALHIENAKWVGDDDVFWKLAKALTEDERIS